MTYAVNQSGMKIACGRHMQKTFVCVLSLSFLGACSAEKGSDFASDVFETYEAAKDDSFRRPTEKGTVEFEVQTSAELTSTEQYLTWTFEIHAQSLLSVATGPIDSTTDTVVYLYHRQNSSERWGRYIAKNDDADGSVTSRITGLFEAGQYRVLVKGHDDSVRGPFLFDCFL